MPPPLPQGYSLAPGGAPPLPSGYVIKPVDVPEDMARSAGAGLAHLVSGLSAGLADIPATVQAAASKGQQLGEKITGHRSGTDLGQTMGDAASTVLNFFGMTPTAATPAGTRPMDRAIGALLAGKVDQARREAAARGPTSNQLAKALPGGAYKPQTRPGKYTKTFVEMSPALVAGQGNLVSRGLQWLAPAAASETAGQLTEGTRYEVPARILAALAAGAFVAPRSAPAADAEALSTPERRVASVLDRNLRRDNAAPDQLATFAQDNPRAPTFHAAGPNVTGLAEVAAQVPGPAQRLVRSAVLDDQAAAPRQASDMIGSALGGKGDYFASLDKALAERKAAADAGMAQIADQEVTLHPDVVTGLRGLRAKAAIGDAAENFLISPDPETRNVGARLQRLAGDVLDKPSAQTVTVRSAQDISKALLSSADSAFASGDGARGSALAGLGRAVRTNAATPEQGGFSEYADWLAKYGADSDNIGALKMGRAVFSGSQNVSAEQIGRDLAEMGPSALDFYRKGVGEAVLDKVRKTGVVGFRQALKDEYGDRLRLAFPDDDSFKSFLGSVEGLLERQGRNQQIVGNPRTFGRQAAAEDLNQQHGIDPIDATASVVEGVISPHGIPIKAAKHLLKAIPRKDRSVIGDEASNAVLGHALTDPEEAQRILRLYRSQKAAGSVKALPGRVAAKALTTGALTPAVLATRPGQ
jgi:hypothetical protein